MREACKVTTGFWKDKYPEGIPATIDTGQYRSIIDVLEYSTRKYADKPAFSNLGKEITYARLWELSGQFCSYLQNHTDLRPGDRIANYAAKPDAVSCGCVWRYSCRPDCC